MVNKTARLLLLLIFPHLANALDVNLSVEPPVPLANESFRLIFHAGGKVDAEPDFKELDGLVDILGRNRQTSIQWINGKNTRSTTWVLDVIVTSAGTITLPSVAFGKDRSRSSAIEIAPRGAESTGGADTGLILEIEVDKQTPYVQEQIILTARLLRRIELNDAKMTSPSTDADAIIKRLGTDRTYQTTRDGKRYEVFERHYSIFIQSSGPATIAPLTMTTQIVQSSRAIFAPFRQTVKTRRIESNALHLEVKSIPSSFTGSTWLPAKRLRLRDDWDPDSATVTAGEPLTRTVFLWADGLNAGQLPELSIALPAGLKSYPDLPQTSEQETDDGFSAIRQQNYALIPNTVGELVFPEISIAWWNTDTDSMEIARLGQRRFMVEGALNFDPTQSISPIPQPADIAIPPKHLSTTADAIAREYQQSFFDRGLILALVFLLGWLATAIAWWKSNHRRSGRGSDAAIRGGSAPSLARARSDVLRACKANSPTDTKLALLRWGKIACTEPLLNTLGGLAKWIGEPIGHEIRLLDEHLYGKNVQNWDYFSLHEAFKHGDIQTDPPGQMKKKVNTLPDLNHLAPR